MWGVLLVPSSSPTLSPVYDGVDVNVTSNVTWFHLNHDMLSRRIYKLSFYGGRSITELCGVPRSTKQRKTLQIKYRRFWPCYMPDAMNAGEAEHEQKKSQNTRLCARKQEKPQNTIVGMNVVLVFILFFLV